MSTSLAFTASYGPGLNLNSPTGFQLVAPGVWFEDLDVDRKWLSQPPHPGAVSAGDGRSIRIMHVHIRMTKQSSVAAMKTLQESLNAELDRKVNEISWTPDGWPDDYLIDTYRAPLVSLFRGQEIVPTQRKQDLEAIELKIPVHPVFRGAGQYI